MLTRRRTVLLALALAAVGGGVFALVAQGKPTLTARNAIVYSAKFVCGNVNPGSPGTGVETPVFGPGIYRTAINVHNPNADPVKFGKKAVLILQPQFPGLETPQPPGEFRIAELPPDWGLQIDCPDIATLVGGGGSQFFEGWVVLVVPDEKLPLDVEALYTVVSGGDPITGAGGETDFELERVKPAIEQVNDAKFTTKAQVPPELAR
jgi:hypothetical protein